MNGLSVLQGILLVSSNAALIPAIVYATRWALLPEAAILSIVLVVSSLYHMCQAEFVCVLGISLFTFQLQDHFWVYSAIIWIALYFIGLDLRFKFLVFIWVQTIIFPLVLEFIKMWWFGGLFIGIVIIISIMLITLVIRGIPRFNVVDMLAAIVLVVVGFVFHVLGGDPIEIMISTEDGKRTVTGSEDYPVYHTVWHILVMIAVYYILDLPNGYTLLARSVYSFYHDCMNGKSKEVDALYFKYHSLLVRSSTKISYSKKRNESNHTNRISSSPLPKLKKSRHEHNNSVNLNKIAQKLLMGNDHYNTIGKYNNKKGKKYGVFDV